MKNVEIVFRSVAKAPGYPGAASRYYNVGTVSQKTMVYLSGIAYLICSSFPNGERTREFHVFPKNKYSIMLVQYYEIMIGIPSSTKYKLK